MTTPSEAETDLVAALGYSMRNGLRRTEALQGRVTAPDCVCYWLKVFKR